MTTPIEYTTISKTGDERGNHDGIVVSDAFLAVVDAYQARGYRAWQGKPAGIFAKELLCKALEQQPADAEARDVVCALEETLQEQTTSAIEQMQDKQVYAYPMARLLVYSAAKRQIWRLGDSPFVVDGTLHFERSQALQAATLKRAEVTEKFLARDNTDLKDMVNNDYGRTAIMEDIVAEERRVDGVECLSGRADVDMDVLLGNVEVFQLEVGQEVILASDGYPQLLPSIEESEAWLKEERDRDPLFVRDFKALRTAKDEEVGYDDRSYVRFVVD